MPQQEVITFSLNGKVVEVPKGTTILQAAGGAGVEIPHLCYHPYLSVAGNCRMCMVEVEKSPKLVISCATPAAQGLVVRTDTPTVKKAVRGVLEFLLINHPIDCPVCDQAGECKLQDYYMAHGLHESRITLSEKVRKRKALDLGPIVLDSERCVLCARCIRYLSEVTGTNELGFFERGDRTQISAFLDSKVDANSYAGNLADICPVGAITSKDFRFRCRVWFLKGTPAICPECSTGCNMRVDHRNREVYRFVARLNPYVNKTWLCDAGRFSYKNLNGPERLLYPMVRKDGAFSRESWAACMSGISRRLKDSAVSGSKPVAILSTRMTNEELFLAKKVILGIGGTVAALNLTGGNPSSMEDFLLRRKDHTPNTTGAQKLGLELLSGEMETKDFLGRLDKSRFSLLVTDEPAVLRECGTNLPLTIALATHRNASISEADIVLPMATHVEREGTLTNFEGRVQRTEQSFPPPGEARSAIDIISGLSGALGMNLNPGSVESVFSLLAKECSAFSGLAYENLGEYGSLVKTT
ncbi:MAG: 2Fe-2S iron-sulfur cluster-binding protein [Candidatus Eisenbacteria bacterium]|nr:2Fe-2S iron-sulfur cluster-binding protein [Candidatus Eisenbacteria bacterium]